MHSIQLILIQADTAEEAFSLVADNLSEGEPRWSDWHTADESTASTLDFAGRWSGDVFKDKETDENKAPNYLRYSDDPALAERVISTFLEYRFSEMRECRDKGADLASYSYDPYSKRSGMGMDIYYAVKLAKLLNDEWTSDTAIYDLQDWTANLGYFIERVKKSPETQWLIPVDFHH
jgi:hypothetical protein